MAVMTKAEAMKFMEMDDRMIDILDFLRDKKILNEQTHRKILLSGYFRLVEYLEKEKIITGKQAKEAQDNGFDDLIIALQ